MTARSETDSRHCPVLPLATGAYEDRAPIVQLREQFSRTWFNTSPSSGAAIAVVPDGYIDLQWIDGVLRVAGPDRAVNRESLRPSAMVVGLRFRPGAASLWLGVPASAIVGARVPLEAFWGAEARRIAEWVGHGPDRAGIARRLEAALVRRAANTPRPDHVASQIRRLLELTPDLRMNVVRHICVELGLSERTLRRRCQEAFGYGPKMLQRIVRFQRVLQLTRASAGPAALASEGRYADQAHLTREARHMTGMTPAAIWEQLSAR